MIKKMRTNEGIQYKKLTPEEMKAKGILGRLIGPCADFINPTRNGRGYSEQLWENVFNDPIMQEKIKNGVCFGELGHPADRTEVDMEKIAICLREQPMKNDEGKLVACFDILDTPNGRILKTLCDYGSTVGVSSRGQGDLITDAEGNEAVDPDTYECECWDVVLVPAVKEARMQYVTEGLDKKTLKLKKALSESLNSASKEEKKIMEETLENLNIKLDEASEEAPVVEEPIDELPSEEIPELEITSEEEPVEENPEAEDAEVDEEDIRTDEEIFLDYLANNFDEDQIKKACKALDIDVEEVEEAAEEDDEESSDEEPSEEDADKEVEEKSEEPEEKVEEALVTVTSAEGTTTVDTDANTVNTEAETVNVDASKGNAGMPLEEPAPLDMEPEMESPTEETPLDLEGNEEDSNDESHENIDEEEPKEDAEEKKVEEAVDNGAEALVRGLQEALKGKSDLESSVKSLQEKLAASDARVNELVEECEKYKGAVARLSTLAKSNKDLKESVSKLEESLSEKEETINTQQLRISRLVKSRKETVNESASLNESLNSKTSEITSLNEEVKALKEQLYKKENETSTQVGELTESLNKETTLKESYKKLANKVVNRYIEIKANMIGLTATDVKRKLGESYSIEDVDKVCEDLKSYQLNVSKLPFEVNRKVGVRVNEGSSRLNPVTSSKKAIFDEDEVDDGLIRLANI